MAFRSFIIFFSVLLFVTPAQAGQWSDEFSALGFDDGVSGIRVIDSQIMVCGEFSANGNIPTPGIATWTGSGWEPFATYPPFRDPVHIAYMHGMVFTNGFNNGWMSDGPYRWTGTQWELMGSGLVTGYVNRINCSTTYQGKTIVGGFSQPPVYLWEGLDWYTNMPPNTLGVVNALVVYDDVLYAAGSIYNDDIPGSDRLMCWDGQQWDIVTALDPATMMPQAGLYQTDYYGYALTLTVHDDLLYIGGSFDHVGTMPVSNIVALDAATGQWVQVPALLEAPNSLTSFGGDLYAGGPAGTIANATGPGSLGRLIDGVWSEAGLSPNGSVAVLTPHDDLLIGGKFNAAGGAPAGNFTTWDGTSYSGLANSGGEGVNGRVSDLETYGSTMLAAGNFNLAGDLHVTGLAQWNNPGWSAFAGGGPDGSVENLLVQGSDLYMVGEFSSVNGQAISHAAHYDGMGWSGFDVELPSPPTCAATLDGELYVGSTNSYRNEENSLMRGYLARWTGNDWDFVIVDGSIYDLETFNGEIWGACKNFELEGTYPNIVTHDGATLTGFPYSEVHSAQNLSLVEDKLFILGDFDDLWIWDGANLETVYLSNIQVPDITSGLGLGRIYEVQDAGDRLYLGTGGDYNGYTAWEWIKATDVVRPLDRGTNGGVNAICQHGNGVFFGGWFSIAGLTPALNFNPMGNPIPSSGIARWNPSLSPVDQLPQLADGFNLRNAPNPFNPSTTISFDLPVAVNELSVDIYDARGRLVRSYDLGPHGGGHGSVVWDGKDRKGGAAASGVYLYRLDADQKVITRAMTLVK